MTSKNTHAVSSVLEIGNIIIECESDFNLAFPLCDLVVSSENRDISSKFTLNPENMVKVASFLIRTAEKTHTGWKKLQEEKPQPKKLQRKKTQTKKLK